MKSNGFFITGTDTGVGKTVVTACLLSLFRNRQLDTGIMKPIETGVDPLCSSIANSDAKFLMAVGDCEDEFELVCPVQLTTPASPLQAARMENRVIEPDAILKSFDKLARRHKWMLVEGIGGLLVPICPGYFVADLIKDLGLPVILVSRTHLGTLNHTLLTLWTARERGIGVSGVILNHMDDGDPSNVEKGQGKLIEEISGIPVMGECPFLGPISPETFSDAEGMELIAKKFDLNLPGLSSSES